MIIFHPKIGESKKGWLQMRSTKRLSQLPSSNGPLDFFDCLGDLDFTRACFCAVKNGMAAPDPKLLIKDLQAFISAAVPVVKYKPMGVNDG